MATLRERPYVQFNFLVDLGTGNTNGPEAGFQEVSGIGMEVTVAEYRTGNHKENSVMKITGLNKMTDVTLKRGVIGSLNLYQWLNDIRNGDQKAYRNVTIQLQNEDHTDVVATWKLLRARIIKNVNRPVPMAERHQEWRPKSVPQRHHPTAKRGSHGRGGHVETVARAHHQERQW